MPVVYCIDKWSSPSLFTEVNRRLGGDKFVLMYVISHLILIIILSWVSSKQQHLTVKVSNIYLMWLVTGIYFEARFNGFSWFMLLVTLLNI